MPLPVWFVCLVCVLGQKEGGRGGREGGEGREGEDGGGCTSHGETLQSAPLLPRRLLNFHPFYPCQPHTRTLEALAEAPNDAVAGG